MTDDRAKAEVRARKWLQEDSGPYSGEMDTVGYARARRAVDDTRVSLLTDLLLSVQEEALGVDVMTAEEHSLLMDKRDAEVKRVVEAVEVEHGRNQPERWLCHEILRRLEADDA
jgi:hypothetical protein